MQKFGKQSAQLCLGPCAVVNMLTFIPQDTLAKRCIGLAATSWVAALVVLLVFWTRMPAQVPLFYSKPWGQEQLAAPGLLFLPIFLSAVFFIGNLVLAKRLTSQFVSNALLVGGTTVVVLTCVTLIRIVFLVA